MPQTPVVPKRNLKRSLRAFFIVGPIVVFLGLSLLAINFLQALSALFVPISRRAVWAFNRFAANTWWGWCVVLGKRAWNIRYEITGDELPRNENALIVVNHQSMTDVPCLLAFARLYGRVGDLKWFVKEIIRRVPGIGWGMVFLDCVFVRRNWTRDRKVVERVFSRLNKHRTPFWLILFAEGTRMSRSKLERSRAFEEQNGKPLMDHVLSPRIAGFVASVQGLAGSVQAVYDITIGYPDGVPTMWQYLAGYFRTGHLHVRRIPISELPTSDEELAASLGQIFQAKDRALDRFYKTGRF
ncbi:MAG: 1-acyl-sn-glycerol-3-phosphate acyltransferase [Myxococcota bacterium]|jgi:1-acyl-sn-glycerol-3-phosphate acyltransferase|nr:1-acyl-sn-glycerol-3-phosphate acyltransferase [Myxococcota bacterium]